MTHLFRGCKLGVTIKTRCCEQSELLHKFFCWGELACSLDCYLSNSYFPLKWNNFQCNLQLQSSIRTWKTESKKISLERAISCSNLVRRMGSLTEISNVSSIQTVPKLGGFKECLRIKITRTCTIIIFRESPKTHTKCSFENEASQICRRW